MSTNTTHMLYNTAISLHKNNFMSTIGISSGDMVWSAGRLPAFLQGWEVVLPGDPSRPQPSGHRPGPGQQGGAAQSGGRRHGRPGEPDPRPCGPARGPGRARASSPPHRRRVLVNGRYTPPLQRASSRRSTGSPVPAANRSDRSLAIAIRTQTSRNRSRKSARSAARFIV